MEETMEKKLTVKEALIEVMNTLNNLVIPIALVKQLGVPVRGCVETLSACIASIPDPKKPEEEAPGEAEPNG